MNRIILLAWATFFCAFNTSAQDDSCTLLSVYELIENMQLQLDAQQETIDALQAQEAVVPMTRDSVQSIAFGLSLVENHNIAPDLSGYNLNDANLSGVNLNGADLSGADLRWADLSSADLSGADLSGADLSYADLKWANANNSNFSGANLEHADMLSVNLSGANLSGVNFDWADVTGGANLSNADLSGANLNGGDFAGANLSGANLTGATMTCIVATSDGWSYSGCPTLPSGYSCVFMDHCGTSQYGGGAHGFSIVED